MKKIFILFSLILGSQLLFAQSTHIKWSTCTKVIDDKNAEVIITAKLDKGWHLFP